MIENEDVNKAYDALENAFADLAALEDEQSALVESLDQYKEGSPTANGIKAKLREMQPRMIAAQRTYRLACMRCDRVRLLAEVEKTALGRD
jgi:exonuclease VII small subunit